MMPPDQTALTMPEFPDCETLSVPVLKVFDGDGFLTQTTGPHGSKIELSVRFGFIDAPEIGQPGGLEAKSFLSSLIAGKWVDLAILVKSDTNSSFDRHGRIVAIPYLSTGQDGLFASARHLLGFAQSRNIELEMVANGWAWVLSRYGPDQRYLTALDDARRCRRGIWAFEENLPPWEFKRRKYVSNNKKPALAQRELRLTPDAPERCPKVNCGGDLRIRHGRYGKFAGCSNFPDCRYTKTAT